MRLLCLVAVLAAQFIAAPSKAASPSRPNILFCIADDATWLHCSAYGCPWTKTPGFDRVARQGLLFRRAYTPNSKCAPSRACILTGRNSWQLGEACNHMNRFPLEFRSYVEVLASSGYFVGKTGKGWGPGLAPDAAGKERDLTGRGFDRRKCQPPTTAISTNDYAANFADFLDACPAGQPFCFWYGSLEPHRNYEPGTGIRLGGKKLTDIDRVPAFWPDNDVVRSDMLDYAYELEYFDQHLSRMLDELERRGLSSNTLVVVTSDNGMPAPRIKGQSYEYSNHLPLAVCWPAGIAKPGRAIDDYVSFVDFAPTFLDVAGVDGGGGGMAAMAGRSLVPIFRSETAGQVDPERDHVLLGKERHDVGRPNNQGYPIRGIVQGGYLYLRNFEPSRWPVGNPETGYLNCDGSPTKSLILNLRRQGLDQPYWQLNFGRRPAEELYNVAADPDCVVNLADQAEHGQRKAALADRLTARLREQADPRIVADGSVFERYPFAWPIWENFYERFRAGEKIRTGWVEPSDYEVSPVD